MLSIQVYTKYCIEAMQGILASECASTVTQCVARSEMANTPRAHAHMMAVAGCSFHWWLTTVADILHQHTSEQETNITSTCMAIHIHYTVQ